MKMQTVYLAQFLQGNSLKCVDVPFSQLQKLLPGAPSPCVWNASPSADVSKDADAVYWTDFINWTAWFLLNKKTTEIRTEREKFLLITSL